MRTESFIPHATRLRYSTEMPGVRYQGGLTSSRPDVIEGPGGIRLSRSPKPGAPLEILILSRHRDESIIIGDDIVITVVDIRGDKVRLGINAPIEIPVHRQEVYEAIQRENEQAARINPPGQREQKPPEPSKQ